MSQENDVTLPPLLARSEAFTQALGSQACIDAIPTEARHDFGKEQRGVVWLILTEANLFAAAATEDELHLETFSVSEHALETRRGVLRNTIVCGTSKWEVPTGYGGRARAFVEAFDGAKHKRGAGEIATREDASLLPLSRRWFEEPGELAPSIAAAIPAAPVKERLLGLRSAQPEQKDAASAWLLVSTGHSAMIEVLKDGSKRHTGFVHQEIEIETSTLGRDRVIIIGEHRMSSPVVGRGDLRRLVELAAMEPVARAISAARESIANKEWREAAEILLDVTERHFPTFEDAVPEDAEEARVGNEDDLDAPVVFDAEEDVARAAEQLAEAIARPLSQREEIVMLRARVALARGNEPEAIGWLVELTRLRPEDDLVESTRARAEVEDWFSWLLLLALAHEDASDHLAAAAVYEHLACDPSGGAIFWLQRARALQLAGETALAQDDYQKFIDARLASDDFQLTSLLMQEVDDLSEAGADPNLVAACVELGDLCEARAEWARASRTYLTLIRQAPFNPRGYERLFSIADRLESEPHAAMLLGQVANLATLINPSRAAQIAESLGEPLPAIPPSYPQPPELAGKLASTSHDEVVIHDGERATASLAQRWVGDLIRDSDSTRDIERHCQQVSERSHPELATIVSRVSGFLGIPSPRLFLSHGLTGIQVLGDDSAPMLLLGASHLDEEHPQYLDLRQQCFAVSSQLEHIRAGHLLLTNSEFWGAFREKALTGAVALLSLVPLGGFLGKFADGLAGGLFGKLKGTWDNKTMKKIVEFGEKKIADGAARDGLQSAYEATLGQVFAIGYLQSKKDDESLLKEQLADFARCAMYTSDRLGLLMCDDLDQAVRAILLLSPRTAAEILTLDNQGLEGLLQKKSEDGSLANQELALRFGELFKFALSNDYFDLREEVFAPSVALLEAGGEEE